MLYKAVLRRDPEVKYQISDANWTCVRAAVSVSILSHHFLVDSIAGPTYNNRQAYSYRI